MDQNQSRRLIRGSGNSLYRLTAQVELNPESSRLLLQSGWRFEGDDWEIKVRSGSGDPTWSS